jgi:hypothetical protein
MKIKSSGSASARISGDKTGLIFGLLLICSLLASNVSAQVIVSDPILEGQVTAVDTTQTASLAKQVLQYTTQLSQLQQQVSQYEQLLMTVEGLGTNISFGSNQLQPITDYSSLIDQNCPSSTGGSIVSGVVTAIASSISPTQSISASQQQLCAQITMVQIDEYNKTISIANLLDTYGGTLQKLNQLANEVHSLGTTSGATTQAATYSASVTSAMSQWQSQVAGDEGIIKALEQQQSVLAKVAMRGQNTILGNVMQAGALAAWFKANPYSPK